jgi:hypothetical protein
MADSEGVSQFVYNALRIRDIFQEISGSENLIIREKASETVQLIGNCC